MTTVQTVPVGELYAVLEICAGEFRDACIELGLLRVGECHVDWVRRVGGGQIAHVRLIHGRPALLQPAHGGHAERVVNHVLATRNYHNKA